MPNSDPSAEEAAPSEEKDAEPAERSSTPPPRRPRLGRLLLVTFLMLLGCDALARVVFYFHRRSAAAEISKQYPPGTYIDDFAARVDYRFVNLYTMNPERGAEGVSEYRYDAMGFRLDRRNLRFDAPDGFKHVWMLGGSTTQGLGTREGDTIAAQLNDRLEKDGSAWRVLNLGQGGFCATQELLLLEELVQEGRRPDAILVYDGINEMPFGGDPIQTGTPAWEKHTPKTNVLLDIQGAQTSGSLTALTLTRWTKLDDAMVYLAKRAHPAGNVVPSGDWEVAMRTYLLDLNMMRSLAGLLNVPVLFYFQPIMQYEEHYGLRAYSDFEKTRLVPQMLTNEYQRRETLYAPALEPLRAPLHQKDVYDAFRGHDGETLYGDPRHPNGAGAAVIAARLYQDVAKLPAVD
jgi:lysophospholipase L1-like esterase